MVLAQNEALRQRIAASAAEREQQQHAIARLKSDIRQMKGQHSRLLAELRASTLAGARPVIGAA